ncbi:TRAP transporter substrate-binding protein [Methylobacterium nodulans]|uniref:TRAP dicarboxylate transporter, DctP subunit n=1 Tax=Methylobacterium nodulans (strain LMG 21967 / CNCM I-2342 / ORS 2060) TaxID=460265 RepID=B8IWB3_METNO|nr:TRAP transporter substrate-binding protein [Methylobacterium nodulans]ACL62703.1 TRAP dicarboxylate transporter, DctP subunit [Methylobacterium nodulans ORS 2060]
MVLSRRGLIAAGLSAPFIAQSNFAQAAQHTLKFVYPDTPSHPFMQVARRFADSVKSRTEGAVEVQVFTTGQLGSQGNMLTGMQTGIIDLCCHTSGFVQTLYPKFMVVDLPFLFKDAETAERMLDGPIGPKLLQDLPSKGIYGLSYGHFGWRVVSTIGRSVKVPSEAKGMKIRVQPGAIYAAMFNTLGANPIQIDLSEIYLALSQSAIEAIETPMISMAASKHDEVIKVITKTNHVYNPGIMMASKRKLDSLASKYQQVIREASFEMTKDARSTISKASQEVEGRFASQGITIQPADRAAYRTAMQPVYDQFRPIIGADLMDEVLSQVA